MTANLPPLPVEPAEVGVAPLNAQLRQLAVSTPYSLDEWTAAAMWLGDHAEVLLPTVEAMVHGAYWTPLGAAQSVALVAKRAALTPGVER